MRLMYFHTGDINEREEWYIILFKMFFDNSHVQNVLMYVYKHQYVHTQAHPMVCKYSQTCVK